MKSSSWALRGGWGWTNGARDETREARVGGCCEAEGVCDYESKLSNEGSFKA